jgi:hypothetical protein
MTLAHFTGLLLAAAAPTALCGLLAIVITLHAEWRDR